MAHEGCLPAGPPCAGAVWPWLFRDPVGSGLWWNRHLAACGGLSDQRRMEASEPLGWRREELPSPSRVAAGGRRAGLARRSLGLGSAAPSLGSGHPPGFPGLLQSGPFLACFRQLSL